MAASTSSSELTSSCRDSRTVTWPEELFMTSVLRQQSVAAGG